MKISWLHSFIAVADMHNFSNAADSLYITQPAISKHIKQIEDECGLQFFDRSSHQLKLTEAGILFYDYACKMVALHNDMSEKMADIRRDYSKEIRIASVPVTFSSELMGIIAGFDETHPDFQIQFYESNFREVMGMFSRKEIDLAIVRTNTISNTESHNLIPLFRTYGTIVVCSPQHRFASWKTIPARALKNEELILTSNSIDEIRYILRTECPELENITPKYCSMNLNTIFKMLKKNQGVFITNIPLVKLVDPNHQMKVVSLEEREQVRVALLTQDNMAPHFSTFIKYLQERTSKLDTVSDSISM